MNNNNMDLTIMGFITIPFNNSAFSSLCATKNLLICIMPFDMMFGNINYANNHFACQSVTCYLLLVCIFFK